MALRMLMANDRIKEIEKRLAVIESDLEKLSQEESNFKIRYKENKDNDEMIQTLYEESEKLDQRHQELETEQSKLVEERKKLQEELKEFGKGEKVEKEVRDMKEEVSQRDALNAYLEGNDKDLELVRAAGLVSDDASVLIPVDVIYQPKDEVYTEEDLEQYINIVSVSTATGKYPVLKRTDEKMHTVEELAENPKLGNPKFNEVMWDVDTYRGVIPISQEALDDSAIDLAELVARHIKRIELNTTNSEVAPIIKAYQPAIAKNIDDLKKLDNVMLDPAYNRVFYMSRSMFHYLDTLKDKDGNYVLQQDISSPSKKSLFGWPVIRVRDNLIGSYNGQLVCFFGDLKAAVSKFDRKKTSVRWVDNDVYGTKMASIFRADYENCDSKAGYYVVFAPTEKDVVITTSDEQTPETVEGVEATIAVENNVATIKYTGLTGQVITYSLKDAKGAVVAEMVGRFTTEKTEDTITVTFAQDMIMGDYTLEAKVLDQKKYKCIKSVKLNLKQKSEEAAKILNGTPIVIANQ